MRTAARLTACLLCAVALLMGSTALAFGEAPSSVSGSGASSPVEGPLALVVPGGLEEGQQAQAAEEAKRSSPEAVAAREVSQTRFENLDPEQAAKTVAEAFPGVIDEPAGGLPKLPAGQKILGYPSDDAAQVDLGEGKRGVMESMVPIAIETSSGQRVPVNLSLTDVGSAFQPATPAVGVRIPKQLGSGVALSGLGVSLTPIDMQGIVLGGSEGTPDGATVLYANTQRDMDTVVKPMTTGFAADTLLRSVESPQQLFFRVGLPEGASLAQAQDGSGSVEVLEEGKAIVTISSPSAQDAAGTQVPISMTASGNVLTLTVAHRAKEYEYPIEVDPNVVTDKELSLEPGNWVFHTSNSEEFFPSPTSGQKLSSMRDSNQKPGTKGVPYSAGQVGYFEYPTQGESRIYGFVSTIGEFNIGATSSITNRLAVRRNNGEKEIGDGENGFVEITEPPIHGAGVEHKEIPVCAKTGCAPLSVSGSPGNFAVFEQEATESGESLWHGELISTAVEISQEKAPTASFDTTDSTVEGQPNALLTGKWYNAKAGLEFGLDARDWGIGLNKEGLSSPNKAGWGYALKAETRNECHGVQCNECYEPSCLGKASGNGKPLSYALASAEGGELPEGEDTIEGKVEDAAGLSATTTGTVKIDSLPPHSITFSGLPSNHEMSDGQHVSLKASATDGTTGTKSSGIASIVLEIDGQQIGGSQGSCSPGPCTGNAEWALSGENYAAGQHTLSVVAMDNAGNVATEAFQITIHHPESVAVGPGSVNPVTGEFSLGATDVSLDAPDGGLTVSRGYRSRHLAQGTEDPLGPQWILSLGAQQSLSRVSGGMVLIGSSGGQVVFESKGGGEFTSPTGDAGLILLEKTVEGKTVFTLSKDGSVTTFELPSGSSGGVWTPSSSEGPNGTSVTLYKFKMASGVIEPTEELAPVPAGVSCGKEISELKDGCRALKFEYANETKAKGEHASEWGSFTGHLSEVKYIAWNASKTKTETTVAEYAYDTKGRLRAEWDPRVTPSPLKTTYGYDLEGHVTAVNAPSRQPWLLEQGTIPSDAATGRLLAVSVPSASTAFGNGEAPTNTEAPTLSSTKPVVGTKIGVSSNGKWNANPLAYSYQWQDCNASGKECTAIPGAVNQAYYPVFGDEGRTLVAQVLALNATGSTIASTAATSTVAAGTPNTPLPEPPSVGSNSVTTLEYQVPVFGSGAPHEMSSTEVAKWGQTDDPAEAMAIFPPDKVMGWPAKEYKRETVYYLDGRDRAVNTASPTGGVSTTEYNPYNDAVRTLSPANRATALAAGEKSKELAKELDTESTYNETGSEPGTELLSTLGPKHNVKLTNGTQAEAREHTVYSYNEGAPAEGGPYHLVTTMTQGAQIAGKEEAASVRTTKTSYSGQENVGWKLHKPTSVTTDPGGLNLVHTTAYNSSTGAVIETKLPTTGASASTYNSQFGSAGSEGGQLNNPKEVAVDGSGNVWVTDFSNSRLEKFSPAGTFLLAVGWGVKDGKAEAETCATSCRAGIAGSGNGQFSEPVGIAVGLTTGNIYVVDRANHRVQELTSAGMFKAAFGSAGSGSGQMNEASGVVLDASENVWVADSENNRVDEFMSSGVFRLAVGWGVKDGKAEAETCTTSCQAGIAGSGNGQFHLPHDVALSGGNLYVTNYDNNRVEEFSEKGAYIKKFGTTGSGSGQFFGPFAIASESTKGTLYVTDLGNNRVEEFNSGGTFLGAFGSSGKGNGQFTEPRGLTVNASGAIYIVDSGNSRVEKWLPSANRQGKEGANDRQTIYYTANTEASVVACQNHPEWANLPCQVQPAHQPEVTGLPELPVTLYTYNIWDEPETATETVGSTTRTKTDTYDRAGRVKTSVISSTVGTILPTVTYEYNKETGALEKQSTTTESKTKAITSLYNALGQLTSYTDADENLSTYEYDVDGRIKKINNGKGAETYTYSTTTGLLTELLNEYSTTKLIFTATYDTEGNLVAEGYPNGMTATYTYNQVGKPAALVYKKITNCTEEEKEKCKWFKDTVVPSIHGQWLSQTSTLSTQAYNYDAAGRTTQVQNTPVGKSCTTHIYAYDEDTNRASLTTREPNSKGECATEGGTVEGHAYDTADRLTDTGTTYSTFGNITSLPAADAGGKEPSENLTSTYYVDNRETKRTDHRLQSGPKRTHPRNRRHRQTSGLRYNLPLR